MSQDKEERGLHIMTIKLYKDEDGIGSQINTKIDGGVSHFDTYASKIAVQEHFDKLLNNW